ncbi:MAG: T9SS type A sorting domain-containing protein [bacterium]
MRKIVLIFVLIHILILSLNSQGWVEIFKNGDSTFVNPEYMLQLAVNSKNEIYVLGFFTNDFTTILHKTTDECKSWIKLNLPFHTIIDMRYFQNIKINSKDEIFITFDSIVVRSLDDGMSFDTILNRQKLEYLIGSSTNNLWFRCFNFAPNNDLFLNLDTDHYTYIIKSTDNGDTWEVINQSGPDCEIYFNDDWIVWSVCGWTIYKSLDTCKSFSYISSDLIQSEVYAWPLALALGKYGYVFAMDEYGRIIKSTDKGQSFTLSYSYVPHGATDWYKKISGSKNGIIVTSGVYSLDNGDTWKSNSVGLGYACILDSAIYALSYGHYKIYKFDFLLSAEDKYKIYSKFIISPNPTQSTSKIEYTVNNFSYVHLVMTNITGDIIKEFNLGEQAPGEHIFNIDTKDLPQGMYFIKLIAGEQVETGKLVVVE